MAVMAVVVMGMRVVTMGVVIVTVSVMAVAVGFRRWGRMVIVGVSMVVVTMSGGRVIVVTLRFVPVVVMAVVRRSGMVVMTVSMGVRCRMGGVIVMPVRVMPMRVARGGGVIVVTRMAVVVVRLVLVAHLDLFPSRCSAVIAAKSV